MDILIGAGDLEKLQALVDEVGSEAVVTARRFSSETALHIACVKEQEEVVVEMLRLVTLYQPVWGTNGEALERCRRDLESQLGMDRNKILVIEG